MYKKFYFLSNKHTFWRWSTDGSVIEWTDGRTICYREELLQILHDLTDIGFPMLDQLLLVLAACKGQVDLIEHEAFHLIGQISPQMGVTPIARHNAQPFFDQIANLPPEWHTGYPKTHLIRTIFSSDFFERSSQEDATASLDWFSASPMEKPDAFEMSMFHAGSKLTLELLLFPFMQAHRHLFSSGLLEVLLTSSPNLPQPLDEPEIPDELNPDLITSLLQDPQTEGIASVFKHIQAAVKIPIHSKSSGDLPLGGVSDLTNKGDFDRLLLSELAQDDLLLLARLANNEALFLRREDPPADTPRQRIILLDTTLMTWGIQRPFGMAAALSVAHQSQGVSRISAHTLSGTQYETADLFTKKGILTAMGKLDKALHFIEGLQKFIKDTPVQQDLDLVLITTAEVLKYPGVSALFEPLKARLRYLYILDRDGSLLFYEMNNGYAKLLAQPRFELEQLLFRRAPGVTNVTYAETPPDFDIPAFFQQDVYPLLFVAPDIKYTRQNTFILSIKKPEILILHEKSLYYWNKARKGGVYLGALMEEAVYYAASDSVLAHNINKKFLKVYLFSRQNKANIQEIDLSEYCASIDRVGHNQTHLILVGKNQRLAISLHDGQIQKTVMEDTMGCQQLKTSDHGGFTGDFFTRSIVDIHVKAKAFIGTIADEEVLHVSNSKIPTFRKLRINPDPVIGISENNRLCTNRSLLNNDYNSNINWTILDKKRLQEALTEEVEATTWSRYPNMRFYVKKWANGSQVVSDSRGIIHLKCQNAEEPEISLTMVNGFGITGWASNGEYTGDKSFIPDQPDIKYIPPSIFFQKYIHPFVQRIVNFYETTNNASAGTQ